jgi:hypothetical protein
MLVRAQAAARLAHHLQEAERRAVGAVGQHPDMAHPFSLAQVAFSHDPSWSS